MAQLNITLNQDEILHLMQCDREGAFLKLLQDSLNSVMKAESAEQLHAESYERSDDRTGYRNGSRDRLLNTRIGSFVLTVPKHRGNVPFKTEIFDNYCRSEAALIASMAEMVVNGVSTRKVSKVVETLCGTSISKSAVSDLCKDLDMAVEEFRGRPLTDCYPLVTVDATYFKVREDHRVISKALMIAYATNSKGLRDIIGFGVYSNESKDTWTDFLSGLRSRGLKDVRMFTSDSHEGIKYAYVGRTLSRIVLKVEQLESCHIGCAEIHLDVLLIKQIRPSATGAMKGFGLIGHTCIGKPLTEHLHVAWPKHAGVFPDFVIVRINLELCCLVADDGDTAPRTAFFEVHLRIGS